MHGAHNVLHGLQLVRRRMDDDIRAFRDGLELVVGDHRGDLDDHITRRVKTGHLEVHPREHEAILAQAR